MTEVTQASKSDTEAILRARTAWVRLYQQTGNAGLTCRRCGVSRPTLRKWRRRFQENGEAGLRSHSRRRKALPAPRLTAPQEQTLLGLRRQRKLGPKRIQAELGRLHDLRLSTSTVWHVLHRHKLSAALRPRRQVRGTKRYSRPVPGDRVQIDSCKIRKGLYQSTAVDDCTRMRVLGLYPDRTQKSAVLFLTQKVLPEFSFPLQRVQRLTIRPTAAPGSSARSSRRRSGSRRSSSGRSRHVRRT